MSVEWQTSTDSESSSNFGDTIFLLHLCLVLFSSKVDDAVCLLRGRFLSTSRVELPSSPLSLSLSVLAAFFGDFPFQFCPWLACFPTSHLCTHLAVYLVDCLISSRDALEHTLILPATW